MNNSKNKFCEQTSCQNPCFFKENIPNTDQDQVFISSNNLAIMLWYSPTKCLKLVFVLIGWWSCHIDGKILVSPLASIREQF
jgi:hypothetical protein